MNQTKLSKQQIKIIKILGKESEKGKGIQSRELSHLIAKTHKPLSNSQRSSISRSIKRLTERKLVYRMTRYYSDVLNSWIICNVIFITDKGNEVYNKLKRLTKK